jgi:hypothetical protein
MVWPSRSFTTVPSRELARELAAEVRGTVGSDAGRVDLEACCAIGGFELRICDLRTSEGGVEGLLVPRPQGRFRIVVDPTPPAGWNDAPAQVRDPLRRHRSRFRIAHEIGHSFFYDRGRGTPSRRSEGGTPAEERFCDEFARELLVPRFLATRGPWEAHAIARLQRECDVSFELAARAFSRATERDVALYYRRGAQWRNQWSTRPATWRGLAVRSAASPRELGSRVARFEALTGLRVSTLLHPVRGQLALVASA